jgi:hypothetical protein
MIRWPRTAKRPFRIRCIGVRRGGGGRGGLGGEGGGGGEDPGPRCFLKYEHGINRISAGRLYAIAHALNTPITYFYAGFDEEPRRVSPRPGRSRQLDIARYLDEIQDKQRLEAISLVVRALAES